VVTSTVPSRGSKRPSRSPFSSSSSSNNSPATPLHRRSSRNFHEQFHELATSFSGNSCNLRLTHPPSNPSFSKTVKNPFANRSKPPEVLDDRCFGHPHGNFAFVPSMTTTASTKRYIGCKNDRSIMARISDKATRTKTTSNQPALANGAESGRAPRLIVAWVIAAFA
jgi:hypothetical protein